MPILIWFINILLWFTFLQNPALYQAEVDAGQPCWYQADATWLPIMDGGGFRGDVQPACPYDPTNLNTGYYGAAGHVRGVRGK